MTTTEIKFECISCRQRILVHADAAGMHTDCPTCGSSVTVPQSGGLNDRHYTAPKRLREKRRGAGAPREILAVREGGGAFDVPEINSLQQELMEASIETTRLEHELRDTRSQLAATRAEAAKSHQLQEAVSAEADKLHANARHTQAELKSFQTERLALKNELSSLREKLSAGDERLDATQLDLLDAQARLGDQEAELEQVRRAVDAARVEVEGLHSERAQLQAEAVGLLEERNTSQRTAAFVTSELRNLEVEFEAAKELLNEAQANRTTALRDIEALTEERTAMLLQLEESRAERAVLAQTQVNLNTVAGELETARRKIGALKEGARSASDELGELRRTISEDRAGRDFIEARAQLEAAQAEHAKVVEESREIRENLRNQECAAQATQNRLSGLQQQLKEALHFAEAGSEPRLRRDNDVLRGIVARQNSDLEEKHLHLVRLKRARLALKIIYSIFILGLIAVGVLAVKLVRF